MKLARCSPIYATIRSTTGSPALVRTHANGRWRKWPALRRHLRTPRTVLLLVTREAVRNAVVHGAPSAIGVRLSFPRHARANGADLGFPRGSQQSWKWNDASAE